jgi:uncharacterized protein HemX
MGITGKKFSVALLALTIMMGAGWWFLQAPSSNRQATMPAPTAPLLDAAPVAIDPNEPELDPALVKDIFVSLRLVADSVSAGRDPQLALAVLDSIDQRLSRLGSPTRLAALRQALKADRERLAKAALLNTEDMRAALVRLGSQASGLPNVFVRQPRASDESRSGHPGAAATPQGYWERLWSAFVEKLASVVKVSRVEDRSAEFLTPEQGAWLTEQLQLRLEMALVALEARNAQALSRELETARGIVARGFDADHADVIAFRAALSQLQSESARLTLPAPEASLRALEPLLTGASR